MNNVVNWADGDASAVEPPRLVDTVERLTRAADWVTAGDVARALRISVARTATLLASAARTGRLEVIEPDDEHRSRRYRPVGHVPSSPRSPQDWRQLIERAPYLTERERQALTALHVDPERIDGRYTTLAEHAARYGMTYATMAYHLHNADYKLGRCPCPPRSKIPGTLRRAVLATLGPESTCDLCQRPISAGEKVAIDHIVPVARGGKHELGNLRAVHALCNARDGPRRPVSEYEPPPFGYIRLSEELANGRGPRTWVEIEPKAAAIVRYLFAEYATGRHSMRSLARALAARASDFDSDALRRVVRGSLRTNADRIFQVLVGGSYRGLPRSNQKTSTYLALFGEQTAATCDRFLEVRATRIQRARATREARTTAARADRGLNGLQVAHNDGARSRAVAVGAGARTS